MEKTNVMRLLTATKIDFLAHEYNPDLTDGNAVAAALSQNPDHVFKTLVTQGATPRTHYVFCVPVNRTLHLKKAARAVGEKSVEMLKQRDLLGLTGYVHGGCSPIGMKKKFVTVIDASALRFETIVISAGRRGFQVELAPGTLGEYVQANFEDIIEN
ncbi:MAG: Cys-tRNA(Pro) deacylase [Opitutales bacterium]|nr:Cys-tRNA(Pro) deacylase [Opitutales bacterium]